MGRESRANQVVNAGEIAPFSFVFPIAKIDKEKRLVSGLATSEILDRQGDITDYPTAKLFFTDEALWPGNIREMHQPIAAGAAVAVDCDDAAKSIGLTVRVDDDSTWKKCSSEPPTLKFFSIGGSGERKVEKLADGTVAKRLFLKSLVEVSLVDNGANPEARIAVLKAVDGKLSFVSAEADDPIAKATDVLDAAIAAATPEPPAVIVVTPATRAELLGLVAKLAVRGADRSAPAKLAIVEKAYAAGGDVLEALPAGWRKPEDHVEKSGPESYDIDQALSAISMLEHLLSQEYYDARYSMPAGQAPDPVKVAQVAMLKAALDAVLQFLLSEHAEQFAPAPADAAAEVVLVSDDDTVTMFAKALEVLVAKAGARHSKADQDMVQKVHDVSKSLGAACKDMDDDAAGDSAEKVLARANTPAALQVLKDAGWLPPGSATLLEAAAVPLVPTTDQIQASEPFAKIAAELETTKTQLLESQEAATKATSALETRLAALENLPAGGGPVRTATTPVNKGLGGEAAVVSDGAPGDPELLKAIEFVAKNSDNPAVKSAAAEVLVKVQRARGPIGIDYGSPR